MIANVLNRLRPPPPPAAATCPAREHVPSPVAPCPAPGVCPGCAAAASRRDGHLGQTELFIQFTSLKLQELCAAPGCGRGLCLGTLCSPWAPCHARGEAAQPGCQARSLCQARCEDRVPRGLGGTAGLHGQVRMHVCPCVSMWVQACPGVSRHAQPCLAPPAMPRASWGGGSLLEGATHPRPPTCASTAVPSPCPSADTGACGVPGARGGGPLLQRWGGPAWRAGGSSR